MPNLGGMNELALNSSHDIFLQGDRICRISRTQKRVQQAVHCLLRTEEGEAFTNREHGVPWLEKVAGLPMNHLDVAQKILREKIEKVDGVKEVVSIEIKADGRNISGKFSVRSKDDENIIGAF